MSVKARLDPFRPLPRKKQEMRFGKHLQECHHVVRGKESEGGMKGGKKGIAGLRRPYLRPYSILLFSILFFVGMVLVCPQVYLMSRAWFPLSKRLTTYLLQYNTAPLSEYFLDCAYMSLLHGPTGRDLLHPSLFFLLSLEHPCEPVLPTSSYFLHS